MRNETGQNVADGLRALEQAALPSGREWRTWWNYWSRFVEQKDGWERALVDAVSRLQKNQITLARMIRAESEGKKMIRYNSDGYVWGEETRTADDITREALVWYINVVNPTKSDAPSWAQHLFKAVEGCYLQQARLGLELAAVKRKGYLTLNHSATMPLPTEKEIQDKGTEAFAKFRDTGTETL